MDKRFLYRILLGACLAVAAGGLAAQTPATGNQGTQGMPAAKEQDATSQAKAPAKGDTTQQQSAASEQKAGSEKAVPSAKSSAKEQKSAMKTKKASTSAMQGEKPAKQKSAKHGQKAQTRHAQAKKAPQQMAKSKTEERMSVEERSYREALRGCVTQKDESQRDRCLDDTIEKFHRNA